MAAPHFNGRANAELKAQAELLRQQFHNRFVPPSLDELVVDHVRYLRYPDGRFRNEGDGKKELDPTRLFNRDDADEPEPICCKQLDPPAIADIKPRPWAYGHFLLSGAAAVLGAVDGGGKGQHAVAIALSMITGHELLGEKVWRTGPVVIVTYEDDEDEWTRRIAAACLYWQQHGHPDLDFEAVARQFHFLYRDREQITFAARIANARGDRVIGFPDSAAIITYLNRIQPALFIVDPFNRAHALEDGNSNVMIALVAGEISRIAKATGVAALVLHHLRKGSSGEVDDLMGATSLRATFRSTRILARMTKNEAEGFNLPAAEAWRYSRVASTKENYTPPERARWYVIASVKLGNTDVDPTYPDGDSVGVIATWSSPDAFEGLGKSVIAEIFKAFRAGPGEGEFYSAHGSAKFKATDIIARQSGKTPEVARRILATWKKTGVVAENTYTNAQRKERTRVTVNEDHARNILGSLYEPPEAP